MQLHQLALALLPALQLASAQTLTNCNANICPRQVRASAFPARPTRQDCSAFQTPDPAAVIPATIPAYGSSCANSAAYASACNCIGIPTGAPVVVTPTVVNPANFGLRVNYLTSAANPYIYTRYIDQGVMSNRLVVALETDPTHDPIRVGISQTSTLVVAAPPTYANLGWTFQFNPQSASSPLRAYSTQQPVGPGLTCSLVAAGAGKQLACRYGNVAAEYAVCGETAQFGQITLGRSFAEIAAAQTSGTCVLVTLTALP